MPAHSYGYSDLPAQEDELGFAPAVGALARVVQNAELTDTPLTVGIYGPWGSGKTSLMQMILALLDHNRCIPVWFDAWRYAQSDALWRALLLAVVEALRLFVERDDVWLRAYIDHHNRQQPPEQQSSTDADALAARRTELNQQLDDLVHSLYRSVEREEPGELRFQWDEAGKLMATTVIRAGFSAIPVLGGIAGAVTQAGQQAGTEDYGAKLFGLFQRERARIYRQQVLSLEQFYNDLQALVGEWVTNLDRRLVIFIDDLDRCLPEQAVSVLEALKVFLDIRGCVFVLGVDREIIERGIRVRYKDFTYPDEPTDVPFPVAGRDYLEKIVQVPFTLPPLDAAVIRTFLGKRLPEVLSESDDSNQIADVMTAGLERNPRKVKRTFNTFRLHIELSRARQHALHPGLIAKLVVIQSSFADLYERLSRDPLELKTIEQIIRGTSGAKSIDSKLNNLVSHSDPRLREMLYMQPFFEGCSDDDLRDLVYQSRVTRDGDGS